MSEIANSEGASESEKPVNSNADITFPPFPDPTDADFEDDISEGERHYYKNKFKDLSTIKMMRLHCTACDRHLGCSTRNESRMRMHPMLRTLVCHTCHTFYNSGEFEKGDDGSELYCRWCGQGGQVYCCSECPHVFCAKCIKRNLGAPKIKEIENADDWKCFKCNPRCLWDTRAICWAVLRYCDLKNKVTYHTQDPVLKEAYQKDCAIDHSECCKNKINKRAQKVEQSKKKEGKKEAEAKIAANIISKIPSTIQVKKFASINVDDSMKSEKKPQKRPSSPKHKSFVMKNPIAISPCPTMCPIGVPPPVKRIRLPPTPAITIPAVNRLTQERKSNVGTYNRIRPKPNILSHNFNGFNSPGVFNVVNDNINLSIESLTQGLDMSAVAAMSNIPRDDDVVCTPDFPLEPLCEVTEDNDDDVQCITPVSVAPPKIINPPPLVPRSTPTDMSSDNIIQMTENDVTVNAATGGLKFRVDPQTLSSNKMYRLPDGRIFAINSNPNMPGGYSATIVALAETAGKPAPKGATYAAKLSAVSTSTPSPKPIRTVGGRLQNSKRSLTPKSTKAKKSLDTRECDLHVPVEWYRYNLIDAVDALEYALSRLQKLKQEATTMYLRTRSVNEMRNLHRTLERLLNTSAFRFNEIRDNLNKELKQYVAKKMGRNNSEDEDDDVEILPDLDDNDDPIFIDENSVESNMNLNCSENQEVDLTGAGSSEHNDSGENKASNISKSDADSPHDLECNENIDNDIDQDMVDSMQTESRNNDDLDHKINEDNCLSNDKEDPLSNEKEDSLINEQVDTSEKDETNMNKNETTNIVKYDETTKEDAVASKNGDSEISVPCLLKCKSIKEINGDIAEEKDECIKNNDGYDAENKLDDKADSQVDCDDKNQDSEMSEEMIENLLKEENTGDENENASNSDILNIPELQNT